jgi:hypothetical protein
VPKRYRELIYATVGIVVVTAVYVGTYVFAGELPAASSVVGHWTGVIGFVVMLLAETLYSIRKQVRNAAWGPMVGWLRAHIVMGVMGPYMVLLHSAMHFRGLAGIVMLLTVVVVVSGVVGRYIYTAIPREIEGVDAERLAAARKALATWRSVHVPLTWALFATAFVHVIASLYYVTLTR